MVRLLHIALLFALVAAGLARPMGGLLDWATRKNNKPSLGRTRNHESVSSSVRLQKVIPKQFKFKEVKEIKPLRFAITNLKTGEQEPHDRIQHLFDPLLHHPSRAPQAYAHLIDEASAGRTTPKDFEQGKRNHALMYEAGNYIRKGGAVVEKGTEGGEGGRIYSNDVHDGDAALQMHRDGYTKTIEVDRKGNVHLHKSEVERNPSRVQLKAMLDSKKRTQQQQPRVKVRFSRGFDHLIKTEQSVKKWNSFLKGTSNASQSSDSMDSKPSLALSEQSSVSNEA